MPSVWDDLGLISVDGREQPIRWRVKQPRPQGEQTLEFRVRITTSGKPEFVESELHRVLGHTLTAYEVEQVT